MNHSRAPLIDRVRGALSGATRGAAVDRPDHHPPPVRPGLIQLFVENVVHHRGTVHRCAPETVETTLATVLARSSTVVPHGFPWTVPNPVRGKGLDAETLDRTDAVVTTATLGIATTGTLVLTHGRGQGPRALSLVPDLHVCVVLADQVVLGVPDAIVALDPHRPQTWIGGPSAAGDVELDRVEGMHGPRRLHVLVVDP